MCIWNYCKQCGDICNTETNFCLTILMWWIQLPKLFGICYSGWFPNWCLWLFIMVVTSLFLCNYNCELKNISINVETYATVKQNVDTLFWYDEFNYQSFLGFVLEWMIFKFVSVLYYHSVISFMQWKMCSGIIERNVEIYVIMKLSFITLFWCFESNNQILLSFISVDDFQISVCGYL